MNCPFSPLNQSIDLLSLLALSGNLSHSQGSVSMFLTSSLISRKRYRSRLRATVFDKWSFAGEVFL